MIHDPGDRERAREIRRRWRALTAEPRAAELRVALLAGYTVDPLVPYLGVGLHDAGIAADVWAGPYDQVVQECLDDDSATARRAPHVLVVSPRFEDLARSGAPSTQTANDLAEVVDVAVAAATRWLAVLVVVLPDHPQGTADVVVRERMQALRDRLAALPSVYTVELADVLATVADPLHPALYELAAIPYREEVFATLGRRVARLLALRGRGPCLGVLLDEPADKPSQEMCTAMRTAGTTIHRLSGAESPERQAEVFAAEFGSPDNVVFVTTEAATAARVAAAVPVSTVVLERDPVSWHGMLSRAGVLDRLPVPTVSSVSFMDGEAEPPTLASYIDSLEVCATTNELTIADVPATVDLLGRTGDFTLGVELSDVDLARAVDDPGRAVWLVDVSDRFGDHGRSAVVALHADGRDCVLDAFAVSCPVLGRGVEGRLLDDAIEWARRHECRRVVVRLRRTGRNDQAVDFLRRRAGRDSGLDVRLWWVDGKPNGENEW